MASELAAAQSSSTAVALSEAAGVLGLPPWRRRQPVVVDANVLIADVLRVVRHGSSTLTFLGEHRLAALVTPVHIEAKVCEHLPRVAERTGCEPARAMAVWDDVHARLIRFVELPTTSSDERVAAVADRDPEDGPVAHLASLLAPAVVLTRDKHLTAEGIGHDDWLSTVLVLAELSKVEALLWGGSQAAYLSMVLPGLGVRALARQVLRSDIATGAVVGIAIGLALFWRPQLRYAATELWRRAEPGVERISESVTQMLEQRAESEAALSSRLVMHTGEPSLEAVVARRLAEHWDPLPSAELHRQVAAVGYDVSVSAIRTLLRAHPAFVSVPSKGFQLGREVAVGGPVLAEP